MSNITMILVCIGGTLIPMVAVVGIVAFVEAIRWSGE